MLAGFSITATAAEQRGGGRDDSTELLTWLTALIETAAVPLSSSAPDWNQLLVRVSAARCGDDADDGGLVLTRNIFLLCGSTNIFFLTSTILTLEHSSKDLIYPIRPKKISSEHTNCDRREIDAPVSPIKV